MQNMSSVSLFSFCLQSFSASESLLISWKRGTENEMVVWHHDCNRHELGQHGHHQMVKFEIRLIIFFAAKNGEALYSQQKQDQELTVAQTMNSLLPNSGLN